MRIIIKQVKRKRVVVTEVHMDSFLVPAQASPDNCILGPGSIRLALAAGMA
jgi:hypothetical protein